MLQQQEMRQGQEQQQRLTPTSRMDPADSYSISLKTTGNSLGQNALAKLEGGELAVRDQNLPLSVLLKQILGSQDMDMLRDAFIYLDSDGDGLIGQDEIAQSVLDVVDEGRYVAYLPYLIRIFDAADKDRDSKLNLQEFLECFADGPGIIPQEVISHCIRDIAVRLSDDEIDLLQRCFRRLDLNEDGLVDQEELVIGLQSALTPTYPNADPSHYVTLARNIIERADFDKDGKLNVSEFIRSVQLDMQVIPFQLLPSGISKNTEVLSQLLPFERDALRVALIPFLKDEEFTDANETHKRLLVSVGNALRGICSEQHIAQIVSALMNEAVASSRNPSYVTLRPVITKYSLVSTSSRSPSRSFDDILARSAVKVNVSTKASPIPLLSISAQLVGANRDGEAAGKQPSVSLVSNVERENISNRKPTTDTLTQTKKKRTQEIVSSANELINKAEKVFRYLDADFDGYVKLGDIQPFVVSYLKRTLLENQSNQEHEKTFARIAELKYTLACSNYEPTCSNDDIQRVFLSKEDFVRSFLDPDKTTTVAKLLPREISADKFFTSSLNYQGVIPPDLLDEIYEGIFMDLSTLAKKKLHNVLCDIINQKYTNPSENELKISSVEFENRLLEFFPGENEFIRDICNYSDVHSNGLINPYIVAKIFNVQLSPVQETSIKSEPSQQARKANTSDSTEESKIEEDNSQTAVYLTPYEFAKIGNIINNTFRQKYITLDALRSSLVDVLKFDGENKSQNQNEIERRGKPATLNSNSNDRIDAVLCSLVKAAGMDKAGNVSLGDLATLYNQHGPIILKGVGLAIDENGVEKAMNLMTSDAGGIQEQDRRAICQAFVDIDYNKDGVIELTKSMRALNRTLVKLHPGWTTQAIEAVVRAILNSVSLDTQGQVTFIGFITALSHGHYVVPRRYLEGNSAALSRRLDLTDISKIRESLVDIAKITSAEEQREEFKISLEKLACYDVSSIEAITNSVFEFLKSNLCSPVQLSERLEENCSVICFPLMLPQDCQEVCLRKLSLVLPSVAMRAITHALLLLDSTGDGLLPRSAVEYSVTNALKNLFLNSAILQTPSLRRLASEMTPERIYEISRLIVLSQYETAEKVPVSATAPSVVEIGKKRLVMDYFIDGLVKSVKGSVIPPRLLPEVKIEFKTAMNFNELELLQAALSSVLEDFRGQMTGKELHLLLSNAIQPNRNSLLLEIEDLFLKLGDGPELEKYDLTEVVKHCDVTLKCLVIKVSEFDPAVAEKVTPRVFNLDSVRRLSQIFLYLDRKNDGFLDHDEFDFSLVNDASRSVDDKNVARQLAYARYGELDLNKDGYISLDEFLVSFCHGSVPALSEQEVEGLSQAMVISTEGSLVRDQSGRSPGPRNPTRASLFPHTQPSRDCASHPRCSFRYLCHSDVMLFEDEFKELFNKYDVNHNGYLEREEFQKIYKNLESYGINPSDHELKDLFDKVCHNKNKVSYGEFCILMLRRSKM